MVDMRGSHFLSIDQFHNITDIETVCTLAHHLEIIVQRKKMTRVLQGAILATFFFEPSTRTRLSFSSAFHLLGGSIQDSAYSTSSMKKGESIGDTSRCVSGYADIIVVRHPDAAAVAEFANYSKVPVINAGSGIAEHPTQALVDIYTISKEYGRGDLAALAHLSIAIVGDLKNGRTAHSLAKLLSQFKCIQFYFVSPNQLAMPPDILHLLRRKGCIFFETDDLTSVASQVDIIYMTRIQEERFSSQTDFLKFAGKYVIDQAFYTTYCLKQPILMHPLPRNARLASAEIHHDLDSHPKLAIFRQSDNGVAIRMALFCLIFGVEDVVLETLEQLKWHY